VRPILFLVLILVAIILERIIKRAGLTIYSILVLWGFIASEIITSAGIDMGIRWYHFQDISFNIILPVVVFSGAITLAISIPLEFPNWFLVQSVVYGIVIFDLVIKPIIIEVFMRF
jgi:hypothetical protein